MIPVNLRNYFPSQSMTNFFGWIEISFVFQEDTTFEDVLAAVKEQFVRELTPEKIAMHMNGYVRIEKHVLVRMVPLELKRYFLMAGANLGSRSITAVYSNIGILKLPEEYRSYIERFGIFASTGSLQLCSCSYEGKMVLGFTSKLPDDSIQRNFLQILKKEEIPCTEEKNDFPGCQEHYKKEDKKVFQLFTFLCIAAAVLCGMINYLTADTLDWFWFAGAGCLCTWLIVAVAYMKRRNLLKNEMWQLLLVTGIAVLWDIFTGWRGWSVDFIFPIWALTVLCSIPLIAKVLAPGERRVPFLSDPGRNGRLCPRDPFMDGIAKVHLPISDLQRHQLSGSGGSVYLSEEGYDTGIQKEIKDVKETTGSGKK